MRTRLKNFSQQAHQTNSIPLTPPASISFKNMYPGYIEPPLEFKLVDSQGIPTRAKLWPSKKPCQTYLLFIPGTSNPSQRRTILIKGNPGVISYYDEFLSTLHEDSPSTTILGLSLAGHEEYELSSPLSLQQQIENKLRIVDMILSSPPFSSISPVSQDTAPKLVVMGHSVGAYMALQVLKQRPQNVDHLFLLFPTISHISKGGIFSRFSSLMTSIPGVPSLLGWMTFLLRFIFPIPLLALLLRFGHSLPGTSLTTTLYKFFNPSSVHSFCHLAKYEFREIKELDMDSLAKYSKRITAYFAVKDRWVPQFARDQIISIVNRNGGDAILCNEGFPHAFSLGSFC